MKNRIIFYNLIISVSALLMMFVVGIVVARNNNYEHSKLRIIELAHAYADGYNGDNSITQVNNSDIRITIIAQDGKVIADSLYTDVSTLDNHINRPEIQSAINENPSAAIRYSDSLGLDMIYYALKVDNLDDYVFIRIALPIESINSYIFKTIPSMLIILVLSILAVVLMSVYVSRKALYPYSLVKNSLIAINAGNYKKLMPTNSYEEINATINDINDISEKLDYSFNRYREQTAKLDYIINHINDGIIAVNVKNEISLINTVAMHIFNSNHNVLGKNVNFLTNDAMIINAIKQCIDKEENALYEIVIDKRNYLVTVKNISGWERNIEDKIAVLILSDITINKNNEKLRSEFFANASHELKTPLTSIKGFNELVEIENKDKNLIKYITQIAKESDRMLTLINDMLKLSDLENKINLERVPINVAEIAMEVMSSLKIIADEHSTTISVKGEGIINAEAEHIYELIKNLTENAVKYNNIGGTVNIIITDRKDKLTIEVSDNGIGIDSKHQARIFERFYRVEKSRSRGTGGTGLGLAIVKHICELYDAQLTLKSRTGIGTTVLVVFRK